MPTTGSKLKNKKDTTLSNKPLSMGLERARQFATDKQLAAHQSGQITDDEFIRDVSKQLPKSGRATTIVRHVAARKRPFSTRLNAASQIAAVEAEDDASVLRFRAEVLGGRLLHIPEVEGWVEEMLQEEGSTGWVADVAIDNLGFLAPDAYELVGAKVRLRNPPTRCCELEYSIPGSKMPDFEERRIRISPIKSLTELQRVSVKLASRYGWRASRAATFILTGTVPVRGPLRIEVKKTGPHAYSSSLSITCDFSVPPEVIAAAIKDIHRQFSPSRPRAMSEKMANLAVFAAKSVGRPITATLMEKWNGLHPRHLYLKLNVFKRDMSHALSRILNPPIKSPSLALSKQGHPKKPASLSIPQELRELMRADEEKAEKQKAAWREICRRSARRHCTATSATSEVRGSG